MMLGLKGLTFVCFFFLTKNYTTTTQLPAFIWPNFCGLLAAGKQDSTVVNIAQLDVLNKMSVV